MTIEDKFRTFIVDELRPQVALEELTDNFPLLKNYVIESIGVFLLVSFMEDELGVEVLDEEIVPEHFENIEALAALVRAKQPRPSSLERATHLDRP